MEEVVMSLRTRKDFFSISTNIDTTLIHRASHLVKTITGMIVQPNKAIVGANAFAHESGIHQDGVLKNRETYEIMTPQSVGLDSNRMVLGRHSGRAGFKDRIVRLGYNPKPEEIETAYSRFLEIADKKKEVFDEDIVALFTVQNTKSSSKKYDLKYYQVTTGSNTLPMASIRLQVGDAIIEDACTGNGPVDSVFRAIEKVIGKKPLLLRLVISPVTEGTDALCESSVTLQEGERRVVGKASSTDIIHASAASYIDALNRLYE
jgi:2-isopropylmalate synthase